MKNENYSWKNAFTPFSVFLKKNRHFLDSADPSINKKTFLNLYASLYTSIALFAAPVLLWEYKTLDFRKWEGINNEKIEHIKKEIITNIEERLEHLNLEETIMNKEICYTLNEGFENQTRPRYISAYESLIESYCKD